MTAFDCVLEFWIKSYRISSSGGGLGASTTFSSTGRRRRRAVESVRCGEDDDLVEGVCFSETEGALEKDGLSLKATDGIFRYNERLERKLSDRERMK